MAYRVFAADVSVREFIVSHWIFQLGPRKRSPSSNTRNHQRRLSVFHGSQWFVSFPWAYDWCRRRLIQWLVDPLFFLHHAQLDRLWWMWQKAQPVVKQTEDSGKAAQNSVHLALASDVLPMGGLAANVHVFEIMNTRTGLLCYRYWPNGPCYSSFVQSWKKYLYSPPPHFFLCEVIWRGVGPYHGKILWPYNFSCRLQADDFTWLPYHTYISLNPESLPWPCILTQINIDYVDISEPKCQVHGTASHLCHKPYRYPTGAKMLYSVPKQRGSNALPLELRKNHQMCPPCQEQR